MQKGIPEDIKNPLIPVFFSAIIILLIAYYFEYVEGYTPCSLCLKQRLPYIAVITISGLMIIGRLRETPLKITLIICAAIMTIGMGIAIYHAGIEWKFWNGPDSCATPRENFGLGKLPDFSNMKIVLCDQAPWRFIGLSFAGWNAVISIAIVTLCLYGIKWENKYNKNQGSNSTSQ